MATRLYLPGTPATTRITPTPDTAWEDTSALARIVTDTAKISDPLATVSFADADKTDKDVLLRQYVTKLPLTVGQTITGAQAIKFQVRAAERIAGNNLFTALNIRVIKGTTVNKTVLVVTRDGVEVATTLTNRQFTATSAATNYTTVAGDFLVIEIGCGGDPAQTGGADHDYDLRLGDSSVTDLAEDDTTTTDNNPWVELTNTLTFVADTVVTPPVTALVVTAFAPTVTATNNQLVTPPVTAVVITAFAPTVTATANQLVTPPTTAVVLTSFAPTVSTPRVVTPPIATLILTSFAPTVSTPRLVTPPATALVLTSFAPTVSAPRLVTPPATALVVTSFAPTVSTPRLVTPPIAELILTAFAPTVTVSVSGNQLVTPPVAALVLTGFAPTVTVSGGASAGPPIGSMGLTGMGR